MMAWEIEHRFSTYTLWTGQDAEGMQWWRCTTNPPAVVIEPTQDGLYDRDTAIEVGRKDMLKAAAIEELSIYDVEGV